MKNDERGRLRDTVHGVLLEAASFAAEAVSRRSDGPELPLVDGRREVPDGEGGRG